MLKMKVRSLLKAIFRQPARVFRRSYWIVNTLFYPWLYRHYRKRIHAIGNDRQLFFLMRQDFGTFLVTIHYARLWQELRTPTALVVLTVDFAKAVALSRTITPQTTIISPDHWLVRFLLWLYGPYYVQFKTINRIYARLAAEHLDAIVVYEQQMFFASYDQPKGKPPRALSTQYNPFLDKDLQEALGPQPFLKAYKEVRKILDYRLAHYRDYISLYYQESPARRALCSEKAQEALLRALSIHKPYVLINVSRRDYFNNNVPSVLTRKGTQYPKRYNCLIDSLIARGYTVVQHGRQEQPLFAPRKGFIDYARSGLCSPENDLALFSGCAFFISSKTGPENFSSLGNIPILGLNYTELSSMTPNPKLRFYPKHIRFLSSGEYLPWQDMLQSPAFFDMSSKAYLDDVEYVDMSEEEMMCALEEFLPQTLGDDERWSHYSEQQLHYRKLLTPLHLDLHAIKGVPLNAYLSLLRKN